MKNFVLNKCINLIKNYSDYNDDKLDEIKYGLESIYLTITKTIIIVILSLYLNIFLEMLTLLIFYNILRFFAFGIHASKSWMCWVSSIIIFIFTPYICKLIEISFLNKVITASFCVIMLLLYAPADTHKRPIIKMNQRKNLKLITFILSLFLSYILLNTQNQFLSNSILFSMIIETIMILPITYKLFKMPYKNHLKYKTIN